MLIPEEVRVHLYCGITDMRKSINTLAILVKKGYLQTDGYKGYDWVDNHPDIIHLGCFAHARRPFA